MKKVLLFVFISLLAISGFSQKSKNKTNTKEKGVEAQKVFTDSSLVIAILKDYESIGESLNKKYCWLESSKYVDAGTVFIVSDIEQCNSETYYKVYYNKEMYYVKGENLYIDPFYIDGINNLSPDSKEVFKQHASKFAELYYYKQLDELNSYLRKTEKFGIAIIDKSIYDESEYTEGTSLKIEVYNPTKKTIKYIWFTICGYNAVNDKVGANITKKCIGPIEPNVSGSYDFSYVWFTDIVETFKIKNIKVQYMDNSFKTITSPNNILLPKKLKDLFETD